VFVVAVFVNVVIGGVIVENSITSIASFLGVGLTTGVTVLTVVFDDDDAILRVRVMVCYGCFCVNVYAGCKT
jgi:hypothetical protein